jgi:hypothetical protein
LARWCLKLYTLVLGALGCFLAFIWVCFHLYVLSQTEVHDLRMLRSAALYAVIFLIITSLFNLFSVFFWGFEL